MSAGSSALRAVVLPLLLTLTTSASLGRAQLAPVSPDTGTSAAPAPVVGAAAWKLCRVRVSVLLNGPFGSRLVREDLEPLFHGEELELEGDAEVTEPDRHARIHYRLRLRAALAHDEGVTYQVTTAARLAAAIGYEGAAAGDDQVRHAFLDITDPATRLHEAFAARQPPLRLVIGVAAEPIGGQAVSPTDALSPPGDAELQRFRVEVLLREGEQETLLDQSELAALPGREAVFSLGRLQARRPEPTDPERRLGEGVRARRLGRIEDSGFGDRHRVPLERADTGWHEGHVGDEDDDFLREHVVELDDEDQPRHVRVSRRARKLSRGKRRRLREQQEVAAALAMARERARTLPSGDAVPSGFVREELTLLLTPLHASLGFVQAELALVGQVRLPGEDELTPVNVRFIEELIRGEPFELGLAELAREDPPAYDYVFRLTPQP